MAKRNRLTNNSDETDISSLISGDTVFVIPYFQRAYRWKPERLRQLEKDILNVIDDGGVHFLGAIIVHGRRSNPADPDPYDVIDGQQRLTTLFLYLCAVVRVLCRHGEHEEAAGLFLKYLAVGRSTSLPSNLKLHPCREDRAQLNAVFKDILSDAPLAVELDGFRPKYLPADDRRTGRLWNNYSAALQFLNTQEKHEGMDRIRAVYGAILRCMSVVQIDVWDPTNGPKIFDSLNSRQEPMTIGDLVRNEIFSGVADGAPEEIEAIDTLEWQPFYRLFRQNGKSWFDSYFFPFGLIQNPNIKKSEVYASLRDSWRKAGATPQGIISELREYQDAFLDLVAGTNRCALQPAAATVFHRLYEMGVPSSAYPFFMQVANAIRDGRVSAKAGMEVIAVIESFLVRRSVCGFEPTGLHAVFKRLWADCDGVVTAAKVEQEVRKHTTVVWPDNEDFGEAIQNRSLDKVRITPYLLQSLDRALGGDDPATRPWIEHVLPQSPDKEWDAVFTKEEKDRVVGLLANLVPLSSELNISVSNRPYEEKRKRYAEDSMFKTARQFARDFDTWNAEEVEKRGQLLARLATKCWPH